MINAYGNYVGFGNTKQLQITGNHESFVQNGFQVIKFYYLSGSAVSGNGTGSFILPETKEVEYLVIGGGGSSGLPRTITLDNNKLTPCGGGGAGTLMTGSFLGLKGMQYNTIVGEGGQKELGTPPNYATSDSGSNGAISSLVGTSGFGALSIIAPGGGCGGSTTETGLNVGEENGRTGGSGGGGGVSINTAGPFATIAQSGSASSGSATGTISFSSLQNQGGISEDSGAGANDQVYFGAGGGATQAGGNGSFASQVGGNGGSGSFNAMSGSGRFFAGGGAGGYARVTGQGNWGLQGVGGGGGATGSGACCDLGYVNGPGQEQTGGGGAGGYSGGSGVIIVRYRIDQQNLA